MGTVARCNPRLSLRQPFYWPKASRLAPDANPIGWQTSRTSVITRISLSCAIIGDRRCTAAVSVPTYPLRRGMLPLQEPKPAFLFSCQSRSMFLCTCSAFMGICPCHALIYSRSLLFTPTMNPRKTTLGDLEGFGDGTMIRA